ncbi:CMC1 (predicted) [Pycnogonum litorale]
MMESGKSKHETFVLPESVSGGPHGLGDPNDRSLRNVEREILIPQRMRDRARIEKCCDEVKEFSKCGKAAGLFLTVKCRKENDNLQKCLTRWHNDDEFRSRITEEYFKDRAEYRSTGIQAKFRRKETSNIN